jgi:Flp pilus assembly pilin Flp
MNETLLKLYLKFKCLLSSDSGQDLTEYALVVALIALACISSSYQLGRALDRSFDNVRNTFRGLGY